VLLNLEKFVHVSEGELVVLVCELSVVAETLKQDELLGGALLGNGGLNQFNDELHVVVHCTKLVLLELIISDH